MSETSSLDSSLAAVTIVTRSSSENQISSLQQTTGKPSDLPPPYEAPPPYSVAILMWYVIDKLDDQPSHI